MNIKGTIKQLLDSGLCLNGKKLKPAEINILLHYAANLDIASVVGEIKPAGKGKPSKIWEITETIPNWCFQYGDMTVDDTEEEFEGITVVNEL
jgi:hypothetical protein